MLNRMSYTNSNIVTSVSGNGYGYLSMRKYLLK